MNSQTARILTAVPGVTRVTLSSGSVQRPSLMKALKNPTNLCGQCTHVHLNINIWRTNKRISYHPAVSEPATNYRRHPKFYSSTPQTNKQEVKHGKGFSGEVHSEANFDQDETVGEVKKSEGKIKSYVRRASKMTEKMKEKVADTVKDMNENILTIPNLLSTTRLIMSPVLGYLVIQEYYTVGACLFAVAGITDLLDGFIARNFKNQQSVLGSIIDPLADKCLVTILTLSLTVSGLIPVPLTILMVTRDVGLVSSVFYLRYQSLSPPRTVSKFFNITHATVQLRPTNISKLNTAVQLGLVGFTLAAPVFHYVDHPLLHALWYTTAATTILSGLSYVFSKDAFKFLRK